MTILYEISRLKVNYDLKNFRKNNPVKRYYKLILTKILKPYLPQKHHPNLQLDTRS